MKSARKLSNQMQGMDKFGASPMQCAQIMKWKPEFRIDHIDKGMNMWTLTELGENYDTSN